MKSEDSTTLLSCLFHCSNLCVNRHHQHLFYYYYFIFIIAKGSI